WLYSSRETLGTRSTSLPLPSITVKLKLSSSGLALVTQPHGRKASETSCMASSRVRAWSLMASSNIRLCDVDRSNAMPFPERVQKTAACLGRRHSGGDGGGEANRMHHPR